MCIIGFLGRFVVSSVFCVIARGFLVRTKTLVTFKRYLSHVMLSSLIRTWCKRFFLAILLSTKWK